MMTEAEWLTCDDLTKMLRFLRGDASGRKLRLFAVACCRNVWSLLSDQRSRDAVELAERFADGQATEMERRSAQVAAKAAVAALYPAHEDYAASAAANAVSEDATAGINADAAAFTAAEAADTDDAPADETIWVAERLRQAALLLDIFGNPFRPVSFDPTWATDTVRALAQAIYEDRTLPSGHLDNRRMSLLADTLEQVGCDDFDIPGHCRRPGPHVRGCWVIDAVLGRS
jgi:hypothetical protein